MDDEDLKQALQDYLEKDEETTDDLVNKLEHLKDFKSKMDRSINNMVRNLTSDLDGLL